GAGAREPTDAPSPPRRCYRTAARRGAHRARACAIEAHRLDGARRARARPSARRGLGPRRGAGARTPTLRHGRVERTFSPLVVHTGLLETSPPAPLPHGRGEIARNKSPSPDRERGWGEVARIAHDREPNATSDSCPV